ncbi:hypothetical protein APHAL10511_001108 [Amanita phalloides]|nr:hypothetical protein APHAL10511_001108 [Amanita phalloides]
MSDEENNEYEVESVIKARVERKRGKQLIMKFRVRWKGYSPEDDTWEPIESFEGSEGIIERFWERTNSGGRDFRNMSLFKAGDVFLPMGPPRRKRKRDDAMTEQSVLTSPGKSNELERNGADSSGISRERSRRSNKDDERPSKRNKEQPIESAQGHIACSPSTSDTSKDHHQQMVGETPHKSPKAISSPPSRQPRRANRRVVSSPEYIPASDEDDHMNDGSLFGSPVQQTKSLSDEDTPASPSRQPISDSTPIIKKPSHRSSQPLVKFVDEPYVPAMEGAISTSDKDWSLDSSLKTVKGRYSKAEKTTYGEPELTAMDVGEKAQAIPLATPNLAPPKSSELLQLAGLDSEAANTLPSYEESATASNDNVDNPFPEKPLEGQTGDKVQSLYDAKNKLLPSGSAIDIPKSASVRWVRSTIFDPLTRGLNPDDENESVTKVPGSIPFWLNLDHSFSIPVYLSSSATRPTDSMPRKSARAGVFYKGTHAVDIFQFIHTDGPPGTVAIDPVTKDENKNHYEHFRSRLSQGDLFIVPVGIDVFAFWSADNATLTQNLNIPDTLNKPGNLLFSKIIVDNYSAYSEFVANADPVPWLQYMANRC